MTVVRIADLYPPARDDGKPWTQFLLYEAANPVEAEQILRETFNLAPQDADPRYPMARSFTTELATLSEGWYRGRFRDQTGDLSEYSIWVKNIRKLWIPELRRVALHIMNRTVERETNVFKGTFTDKTRPSESQAWEAVDQAEEDVVSVVGKLDRAGISEEGQKAARALISLRAAMVIERSYYGEQIGTNKSSYTALERDWDKSIKRLAEAIAEDISGDIEPGGSGDGGKGFGTAQFTFPDDLGGMIGWGTRF